MILPPLSLLALWLSYTITPILAATAGSFVDGGNTQVSAMMMFVGNSKKVYILDKAEGNAASIAGHPAWGAVWDIDTHQVELMNVETNVFCASGMHLANGSYATFGGNGAVGKGGNIGSLLNPSGASALWDAEYQDYDGSRAIRVLNPCGDSDDFDSPNCQWFDNSSVLAMQKQRWYSAAEPLGDGTIVLIGGFVNGGYVNRNFPNIDPAYEGGAAEPTYEFYPANGRNATFMQFMQDTSGLNSYAHTFLMASGLVFLQANISTMLWEPDSNTEHRLPDMPNNVARVYPASGAVAMLPLTPANNYEQTILFCGGSDMPADDYGNYSYPAINTWNYPASRDCQRITPEPADGSSPVYVQDDDMLETRTMGQFIILPDGKLLVVNGGLNGTAGYAQATNETPLFGDMPYGMSLASGPVGTPAIYDPNAPQGSRWSNAGLQTSSIARLYHSSAVLLPDATVLIAGSNPNVDVNLTTNFPTEYRAEIFYPPYFASSNRPVPSGIPSTLSYGGTPFDITVPPSSYSGSANDAADSVMVSVVRTGWTTHAMNMGQRFLQLNNTYTVNNDGSITIHTAQMPPNPNLFQPGPAFVYVVINGVPSNGTYVIVGNGVLGTQPTSQASSLPPSVRLNGVSGSGSSNANSNSAPTTHTGVLIGAIVGGIAVIGILGALIGIFIARRRRAASVRQAPPMISRPAGAPMGNYNANAYYGAGPGAMQPQRAYPESPLMKGKDLRNSDSSSFLPLQGNHSSVSLMHSPQAQYRDDLDRHSRAGSGMGMSMEYDPYTRERLSPSPMRR